MAKTLAIALGANIPSKLGPPASTLVVVRGLLENVICEWAYDCLNKNANINDISEQVNWKWSPLFETSPVGGPSGQNNFINAVVLINGPQIDQIEPSESAILKLFARTSEIERELGRERDKANVYWGPRTIDIDLLTWGDLHVKNKDLVIPHPRLIERNFVITPLSAALKNKNELIRQLPSRKGWKE